MRETAPAPLTPHLGTRTLLIHDSELQRGTPAGTALSSHRHGARSALQLQPADARVRRHSTAAVNHCEIVIT